MVNFLKFIMWQKVKKKFLALGRATKFLNLGWVMGRGKNKFLPGAGRGAGQKKIFNLGRGAGRSRKKIGWGGANRIFAPPHSPVFK